MRIILQQIKKINNMHILERQYCDEAVYDNYEMINNM